MASSGLSFQQAVDQCRDPVFVLTTDGNIEWANRASGEKIGRPAETFLGLHIGQLLTPNSSEEMEQTLEGLLGTGKASLHEFEFVKDDLTACRLELSLTRVSGREGDRFLAVGRSLSERTGVQEEKRLADFQALQFQAALVELASTESEELEASLSRLTAVASATLGVARVAVWLFNDEHSEVRCIHLYDFERNLRQSGAVLEVCRYPRHFEALEQCRTLAVRDALSDPLTCELADYLIARGTASLLDVPIRRGGVTVGVLCHEHAGPPRHWRPDERNFAASLADLTALVLETDRRRGAERKLRQSLEQLELFFSQSLDGFFFMMLDDPVRWDHTVDKEAVLDYTFEHQRLTRANEAMLGQYGVSRGQFLGSRPCDLFAHDLEHGRNLWRAMFDAGRLHVESDERKADGSRMWVEGDYICFYDKDGRITGHFGIQRDITERKLAEQTLRRYNQRLELLQQMDRAILSARSVGAIVDAALAHIQDLIPCRRASVAEFDLTSETARLVGVHATDKAGLGPGSELALEIFGSIRALQCGRPHRVDDIENSPDSPARSTLRSAGVRSYVNIPLIAEGELIGALNLASGEVGAFTDEHVEIAQEVANSVAVAIRHTHLNQQVASHATELEHRVAARTAELSRANASLRDSEQRLASVFRSAMDAIIVLDSRRRIVIFNPAAEKVFRCQSVEAVGHSIDQFLAGDFARLLQNYTLSRESNQLWLPEGVRAIRKDGEHFPIEATISRTELINGVLFTIILRDINDRQQAEERLDQLSRQNVYLQEEIDSELNFGEIVGTSLAMQRVFRNIEMVAGTDSTVLLLGETGTGKELIARALHDRSRRRQGVMVKVNCAALPANLVESELFGHEKGSFTGALNQKKGRFELANRGTIFLDEVGELPLDTQTKLLRVLQEQEFERVGGSQTLQVDVRVIAATNRDLREEVDRGTFRMDLYYRLNVFPIEVPPLRQRIDDIPLLADHFVRKFAERMGKKIHRISRDVYDQMKACEWRGNVRELANLMERAVILCQDGAIRSNHLALSGPSAPTATAGKFPTIEEAERDLIVRALERTNGILAGPNGAAHLLGMNRSTLWSRMKKLNIELPKSRSAVP